jgi:hypothetical protein
MLGIHVTQRNERLANRARAEEGTLLSVVVPRYTADNHVFETLAGAASVLG